MKSLLKFIDHYQCPIVNGVIFPSGETILFEITDDDYEGLKVLDSSGDTPVDISAMDDGEYTTFTTLATYIDEDRQIEVQAGEGSYGSDGFIATIDFITRELKWIFVSDVSNPFDEIAMEGDVLIVRSTHNCFWKINIFDPADCTVDCSDSYLGSS